MLGDAWLLTNTVPRSRANSSATSPVKLTADTLATFAACWCTLAQATLEPLVANHERAAWQARVNVAKKHLGEGNQLSSPVDSSSSLRIMRAADFRRRLERKLLHGGTGFRVAFPRSLGEQLLSVNEILAVWTDVALTLVGGTTPAHHLAHVSAIAFNMPTDDSCEPTFSIDVLTNTSSPLLPAAAAELEAAVVGWLPPPLAAAATIQQLPVAALTPGTDQLGASLRSQRSDGDNLEPLPPSLASNAGSAPESAASSLATPDAAAASSKAASKKSGKKGAPATKGNDTVPAFLEAAQGKAMQLDRLCEAFLTARAELESAKEACGLTSADAAAPGPHAEEVRELIAGFGPSPACQSFIKRKHSANFAASTPKLAKLAASSGANARSELSAIQDRQEAEFSAATTSLRLQKSLIETAATFLRERAVMEASALEQLASLVASAGTKATTQLQQQQQQQQQQQPPPPPPPEAAAAPAVGVAPAAAVERAAEQRKNDGVTGKSRTKGRQETAEASAAASRNSLSTSGTEKTEELRQKALKEMKKPKAKQQQQQQPLPPPAGGAPGGGGRAHHRKGAAASSVANTAAPAGGGATPKPLPFWRDNDKLFYFGVFTFVTMLAGIVVVAIWG